MYGDARMHETRGRHGAVFPPLMYANVQNAVPQRNTMPARYRFVRPGRRRYGPAACAARQPEDFIMLYTIAVVLIILWLLGLVTSFTLGGFIHVLIVVAVIMVLLRLISGRGL
jgi:hypothetical protein